MQCFNPIRLKMKCKPYSFSVVTEERFVDVPCGKCAACLSKRRCDWMTRLFFEYHDHSRGAFVTLTYNDDNLPTVVDKETGACVGTLVKRDLQLFMKRLRKRLGNGIRFFAVGEYGSTTFRPHYHMLLFGYPRNCDIGRIIGESWKMGFVSVGSVTGSSINYCTKYVLIGGIDEDFFGYLDRIGALRPFMQCSRRPFIGHSYINDDTKRYHRENNTLMIVKEGVKVPMPRLFRGKIFNEFQSKSLNNDLRSYAIRKSHEQFDKDCKKYGEHHACVLREQRKCDFARRVRNKFKNNEKL